MKHLLSVVALMGITGHLWASPTGFSSTQASMTQADRLTTITQHAPSAVVDWDSFNLSIDDMVKFNQPSSSASLLNRINDSNPSQIHGRIDSNGRIFLLNSNGILFGETAKINVGSLFATTLTINEEDFLAGNYSFVTMQDSSGQIINYGEIHAASGGFVALVANNVSNTGAIRADLGSINLMAGRAVTADFYGDGLMQIQIHEKVLANDTD